MGDDLQRREEALALAPEPAAADDPVGDVLARRCRCGFGVNDFWVRPECRYSVFGSIMYIVGATPRPTRVAFRCAQCNEVIGEIDDPDVLEQYRYGVKPKLDR